MYEGFREVFKDFIAKERQEGINEDRERVAIDMLKKNYSLDAIKDISKLSESVVRGLANSLGIKLT